MRSTAYLPTSLLPVGSGSFQDLKTILFISGIFRQRRLCRSYRGIQTLWSPRPVTQQRTSSHRRRWRTTRRSNCGEVTVREQAALPPRELCPVPACPPACLPAWTQRQAPGGLDVWDCAVPAQTGDPALQTLRQCRNKSHFYCGLITLSELLYA